MWVVRVVVYGNDEVVALVVAAYVHVADEIDQGVVVTKKHVD